MIADSRGEVECYICVTSPSTNKFIHVVKGESLLHEHRRLYHKLLVPERANFFVEALLPVRKLPSLDFNGLALEKARRERPTTS